jgi:hypothetical protein
MPVIVGIILESDSVFVYQSMCIGDYLDLGITAVIVCVILESDSVYQSMCIGDNLAKYIIVLDTEVATQEDHPDGTIVHSYQCK